MPYSLPSQIHLPSSILEKCQSVMLRSNNYTLVPRFVLEMRSVQLLDLSHNLLSALPHAFGALTTIRTLNLSNNKFVAWIVSYSSQVPESVSKSDCESSISAVNPDFCCFTVSFVHPALYSIHPSWQCWQCCVSQQLTKLFAQGNIKPDSP